MKTVIFLGAGASKVEGLPVQDEILKIYFQTYLDENSLNNCSIFDMDFTLINFFKGTFNIDLTKKKIDAENFPTFEEVIGILDLAELRKETIRFDKVIEASEYCKQNNLELSGFQSAIFNNLEINLIRLYLIILIAKVLSEKVTSTLGLYNRLLKNLIHSNKLSDVIFITTNYDALLDNSIIETLGSSHIDYGIEFYSNDIKSNSNAAIDTLPVKLFKLHGSLNWLYCPFCNSLRKTEIIDNKIQLVTDFSRAICSKCNSIMLPVIIPPTFFKDISNVSLRTVWNKTEAVLREVEHVIFCGYSFGDSDIHIKYLLKKVQLSRKHTMDFTVINNYRGKTPESMEEEKLRYKRFLGNSVNYTDSSFADFVENPNKYMP